MMRFRTAWDRLGSLASARRRRRRQPTKRLAEPLHRLRLSRIEWLEERALLSLGGLDQGPSQALCSLVDDAHGIRGTLTTPGVSIDRVWVQDAQFTRLAIPAGMDVAAHYTVESWQTLGGKYLVYPVQAPEPETDDSAASGQAAPEDAPRFAFDAAYYRGEVKSAAQRLSVSSPMVARGTAVVLVAISPFQYDPLTGQIAVATKVDFSLEFVAADQSAGQPDCPAPDWPPAKTDLVGEAANAD